MYGSSEFFFLCDVEFEFAYFVVFQDVFAQMTKEPGFKLSFSEFCSFLDSQRSTFSLVDHENVRLILIKNKVFGGSAASEFKSVAEQSELGVGRDRIPGLIIF